MVKEKALSLPLKLDAYGRFTTTTEQSKIWTDRVRMVIGTNLRERLMRPGFGTLVPSAFMETQDMASVMVTTEIEQAFSAQLSSLKLQSVDVTFDEFTNTTQAKVIYDLPNGETVDTTVSFMYLQGNQPAYEENL